MKSKKMFLSMSNKIINVTLDYQKAGVCVKKISEDFSSISEEIIKSMSIMTNNMDGLSQSINEVSNSTNLIAENMSNISSKNEVIVDKAYSNKEKSTNLINLVNKFKI